MNGKREYSHGFSSPLSAEKTGPEKRLRLADANKQSGSSPTADFSVRDEGSLILLTPLSPSAHEWADEHISNEGYQPWLPTRIIERRYFADICEAILADSLVLA